MRQTLIENRQFSTVSRLSALYAKFQVERNINVKGVLHKDIKQRLKQEFGDSLMIYHKILWSFVRNNVQPSSFVILFTIPVTIIQRCFLVHPYTSQIESLSSFQAKLKNQNSQIVPLQLNFVRRGDPLNQSWRKMYSELHLKE